MLFQFRRRETPWEVVDNSMSVEPVPMYYEDEGNVPLQLVFLQHPPLIRRASDLDIGCIDNSDTARTYVFDVNRINESLNFRNALLFSRQHLLQEVAKRDFNILLLERCFKYLFCSMSRPDNEPTIAGALLPFVKEKIIDYKYVILDDPHAHWGSCHHGDPLHSSTFYKDIMRIHDLFWETIDKEMRTL
jgi:hypothetical protein